jgi:glycosyltransferase involved in cell wall biosynthesis
MRMRITGRVLATTAGLWLAGVLFVQYGSCTRSSRSPTGNTNSQPPQYELVRPAIPTTVRAMRLTGNHNYIKSQKWETPQLAKIDASRPFPRRVAMLSTYPPTRCGIATYAKHLRDTILDHLSIAGLRADVDIIEMLPHALHEPSAIKTPVVFQIRQFVLADYQQAARFIHEKNYSLVVVHHEFGLFGGEFGTYLHAFTRQLPSSTWRTLIMHTVEPDASTLKKHVFRTLLGDFDDVVGLSEPMCTLVRMEADAPPCYTIEHGVPALASGNYSAIRKLKQQAKLALGLPTDGKLLLSAGLLRDGKGLETIVSAMPAVARSQPSFRLVIAGQTHPDYLKATGVKYDEKLSKLAQALEVSDHVILRHTYLSDADLERYMLAADLYVAPYSYLGQTSSGMIPLAMSAGCVVVSSPFLHAISLLGEGRGVVTPVNHPSFLSLAVIGVVGDSAAFAAKAERATAYSQRFIWPAVGRLHVQLMQRTGQWRWSGRRDEAQLKEYQRFEEASADSYFMQLGHVLFSGRTTDPTLRITPFISGVMLAPVSFVMSGSFVQFSLFPINGVNPTRHSHRIGTKLTSVTLLRRENKFVLREELNFKRLDGSSVVVGVIQTVRGFATTSAEERLAARHNEQDFEIHTEVSLLTGKTRTRLSVQRITLGFEHLSNSISVGVHERNSVKWAPQKQGGDNWHDRELLLPQEELANRDKCAGECSASQAASCMDCFECALQCTDCFECSRDAHSYVPARLQLSPSRRKSDRIAQISIGTTNSSMLKDRLIWTPDFGEDWYSPEASELVVTRNVDGNVHYVRLDYSAYAHQEPRGDVRLVNKFTLSTSATSAQAFMN